MDGYPAGSLDHNLPYILVSGLASTSQNELFLDPELQAQAFLVRSEIPSVDGKDAEALAGYILTQDARNGPWNGRDNGKSYKFRVRSVGRTFVLPPRRARLPESTEPPETPAILHSPFSPLSPVSSLYPDGLIDTQWLEKHQDLVPSVCLCFYTLTSDPTVSTLHDNRLKTDINNIKNSLSKSGYKSRLAVAFLSDGQTLPLSPIEGIQERLENIRRGIGLDSKSVFYVAPRDSITELEQAAESILTILYTQSVEYYRDLGRHARKKRGRGIAPQPTVPPTSGTSQTLSLQGWNVRYDFKAGIFAEFRQEMEAALRSYDQAYENLLSPELMDMIPSWSPRWNEARLLADVLSIRNIRCLLWSGQTTSAVRRWQAHRDRMSDLIDRQGRGTNNYGWEAWEARWAIVIANLIEKVDLPGLAPSTAVLYLQPEKVVMGERLQPWEMLHHTGYWYRSAARHLAARRALAYSIPDEDRRPPAASTTTTVTGNAYKAYDTYLCPEPYEEYPLEGEGTNHSQLIIDCLMAARSQFQARQQLRVSAEISIECAREMAVLKNWGDVVALLRPLWEDMSFRAEGWLDIAEDLCWTLRAAAFHAGLGGLVVAIDWELLDKKFTRRPKWYYDISRSLEGLSIDPKPAVKISNDVSSFLSASFIFKNEEGRAGETCQAQLALSSHAFADSIPVTFNGLRIDFEGSLKTITFQHESSSEQKQTSAKGSTTLGAVSLTETARPDDTVDIGGGSVLCGSVDLSLKPGQTRIYEMAIPLREPGEALASSVTLFSETDSFTLEYTVTFGDMNIADIWFGPSLSKRRIARLDAHSIQVQPRPPKMDIKLVKPLGQYYANEPIDLPLEILNAEDTDAVAKLEIHVFGEQVPAFRVQVEDQEEHTAAANPEESKLTGISLSTLVSTQATRATMYLEPTGAPATYEVTVRVFYHLVTDPATPVMKIMAFQLNIVSPFEANYDLMPRIHPDPWPSVFDYEGIQDTSEQDVGTPQPRGLTQKWSLVCHYASFALGDLEIVDLDVNILACLGGARCTTTTRPTVPEDGLRIAPRSIQEAQFDLVAQKFSLDDRGPASLDVAFVIKWRRVDSDASAVNTTTMLVPRYIVLGTEPRVLATVTHANTSTGLVQLNVIVENGSSHFLTFGLSMEPSDEFAFSGAKQTTLHVLPVSRRSVTYRLLPQVRGAFIRPALVVRDKYFQKVLRVIPTEGMKIDKDGLLIWIPPEEETET